VETTPRKAFALGSFVALTTLAVAVSTTTGCGDADDDASSKMPDATPDAQPSPVEGGLPDGPTGPATCPTRDVVDTTKFPWKPPTRAPSSCTQAELDAFTTSFGSSKDLAAAKASIPNVTCRDCISAKESATWAPLVESATGGPTFVNVGGCIAIATDNDACGMAYQRWSDCRVEACDDCPAGDGFSLRRCLGEASQKGVACETALAALLTQCGSDRILANAEAACASTQFAFEGPIRAQCVGL